MSGNASKILEFLSAFLPQPNDWAKDWKIFNEQVKRLEEDILFSSAFPDKNEFRANLDFVLHRLFFYCRFPWIGCKCLIARIGYSTPLSSKHGLPAIHRIPILYAPQVENALYNPGGAAHNFPKGEIKEILDAISETGGDVTALFSLITIKDASIPQETVIVDFPNGCRPDNIFFQPLLAAAEQIAIYPAGRLAGKAAQYLENHRGAFPVWLEGGNVEQKFSINLPRKEYEPMPDWKSGGYIPFQLLCKCYFYSPIAWIEGQKRLYEEQEKRLTEDIVMNDSDKKLKNILSKMRGKARERMENAKKWLKSYEDGIKNIMNLASRQDDAIISCSRINAMTQTAFQHNNDWSMAENYLLHLLIAKNSRELARFCDSLSASGYPFACILNSAQAAFGSGQPDGAIVNVDAMLAHALCVLLRHKMGIGDAEAGRRHAINIIQNFPKLARIMPEIAYVAGMALSLEDHWEEGAKLLHRALGDGHMEAGKWLYEIAKKQDDIKSVKRLARYLQPDACFDLATENGKIPFMGKKLFYLYIAASQLHPQALRALAGLEKSKSFNKNAKDDERRRHRLRAIGIYRKLEEIKQKLSSMELYDCGLLLHTEKNYQSALKYLMQSEEAGAYFLLGRMRQYGDGVAIDFDQAKDDYNKAMRLGHPKAAAMLEKLQNYERKKAQSASSNKDYSAREEYVSSRTEDSGSFCFLTTAACRAKGFADDCDVLMAYRSFRDNVLLPAEEGKYLVEEYYRIAPRIVRGIEQRKDAREIYETMWREFLEPGYRLVLARENDKAKNLYVKLVKWLLKKLDMKFEPGTTAP